MPLRSDRETHYVAAYLEFWELPRDWGEEHWESPISSWAPVRAWLHSLTQGLRVASLRRAMSSVAREHKRGPPLDPIRRAYWAQLHAEKLERQEDAVASRICEHCRNSGHVEVATWTVDGRTRVMSRGRPVLVPMRSMAMASVPCVCAAGDGLNERFGWRAETRQKALRQRLTMTEYVALRDRCETSGALPVEEAEHGSDDRF